MFTPYIGRFAPSPSGPLHMGSLVCALASYLDAKAHHGLWLIRMEDIDPPREPAGAAEAILQCLEAHQLHSEQPVVYQHTRADAYQKRLADLCSRGLSYYCQCTRKRLRSLEGRYDGKCQNAQHTHGAVRLNIDKAKDLGSQTHITFQDRIGGAQALDLAQQGDFIIHRKDGLFAYQLAVVADDIDQNITHVIRGDDLLEATFPQLLLFSLFAAPPPSYGHIPVINGADGRKLSKQNGSPAIDNATPEKNLLKALALLGFAPPANLNVRELLSWGTEAWAGRYTT